MSETGARVAGDTSAASTRERIAKAYLDRGDSPGMADRAASILLAAFPNMNLGPEPPRPVTSEEMGMALWAAYRKAIDGPDGTDNATCHALDAIRDRYATDHGLLTREEVERRARDWVAAHRSFGYGVESLVSALTRPAPGGPDGR